jgi:hypothetical protein
MQEDNGLSGCGGARNLPYLDALGPFLSTVKRARKNIVEKSLLSINWKPDLEISSFKRASENPGGSPLGRARLFVFEQGKTLAPLIHRQKPAVARYVGRAQFGGQTFLFPGLSAIGRAQGDHTGFASETQDDQSVVGVGETHGSLRSLIDKGAGAEAQNARGAKP